MATTLNAGTTTGTSLSITPDTSGAMVIQTSGANAISISSSQVVTFANPVAVNTTGSAGSIANTGGWAITPTGTKLYFAYNGTNVGSLDSSGNFIALGNVTAYGTP